MQLSHHAELRSSQRGIPPSAISTVMRLGARLHRTGVTFYTLRGKDLRKNYLTGVELENLVGITVIVERDGTIKTVYKNSSAYSAIKKKPKRDLRRRGRKKH